MYGKEVHKGRRIDRNHPTAKSLFEGYHLISYTSFFYFKAVFLNLVAILYGMGCPLFRSYAAASAS